MTLMNQLNRKMRKFSVVICAVALMVTVSSCGSSVAKPVKPVFNNKIDSLSYALGMARTNGFIEYLAGQMQVDTAYMDQFVKGFIEGSSLKSNDAAKKAYSAGVEIGISELGHIIGQYNESLFGEGEELLNADNYMNAFISGAKNDFAIMNRMQAEAMANTLANEVIAEINEQKYGDFRKAGEKFLEDKAKEDGVIRLASGVLYKVISQGKGKLPVSTDKVKVKYIGTLYDGTEFDRSEEGVEFPVTGVIKGWQEILQMMPVGSHWEVYIPYDQAYGDEARGNVIKPFSALVFDVELLSIVK